MRTPLVAGNWKMNGDQAMTEQLCKGIVDGLVGSTNVDVLLCPPYTLIGLASTLTIDSSIEVGAQDMDINQNGAFTGQISASMLQDSGCSHVILGHSERRAIYGESDELVAEKVKVAIENGLTAILCVGETQSERETGVTEEVVSRQIKAVMDLIGIASFENIVIAYEPVWAIGTGLTASPEQAQEVHKHIRSLLSAEDKAIAEQCRILYGGSMKPGNAAELIAKPDIDGGLIGGAALKAEDFLGICNAA